jgi:hypothetical protein
MPFAKIISQLFFYLPPIAFGFKKYFKTHFFTMHFSPAKAAPPYKNVLTHEKW